MASHATMPAHGRSRARATARRHHTPFAWALPLALGVIFGFYAAFILRDGGPVTGGQILLGVVAGVVLAALCFALGRVQRALPREVRAAAYGALTACAIGFLVSLNGGSVLRSSAIGLAVGAGALLCAFYLFYMRDEV